MKCMYAVCQYQLTFHQLVHPPYIYAEPASRLGPQRQIPALPTPILVLSTLARSLRNVKHLVCMGPDRCGVHKVWRLHPSASLLVLLCCKPSSEGRRQSRPQETPPTRENTLCLKGWVHNAGKQCASYLCMRLSPDPCLCPDIYRSG
jgi:hypothetical protein